MAEVLDDTLALFEEILEPFPRFGYGPASWALGWKFAVTGECNLEPCDELGWEGGFSIMLDAKSEADLVIDLSEFGLLIAGASAALLSVDLVPPLTMSLIPPTESLIRE